MGLSRFSGRFKKIKASQSRKEAQKLGIDLLIHRENKLREVLKKNYEFVTGHVRCTAKTRTEFDDDWNFITLLRHPVDRWFSHYFFNAYKKGEHFATDLSLEEFVASDRGQSIGSLYLNYFNSNSDAGESKRIKDACNNLEKFKLVGILEEMDKFVTGYEKQFGSVLTIEQKNKNPAQKSMIEEKITDEIRSQVTRICAPDLEIYEFVKNHLQ